MKFATKAIHAGNGPEEVTGAIMPPIYMTSTFVQSSPGETKGYDYTRAGNPNFTILEKLIASLENGKEATVFSSGLGALTGLVAMLQSGDKVICLNGVYGGTYRLFNTIFKQYGIELISVHHPLKENLEKAFVKKPKWLFFETPTNPLLEIFDIQELANYARQHNVLTVVDNTFATPYFQNPLNLGIDVVWHSTTKYVGGHSDVIGGAVVTNDILIKQKLDFNRMTLGLNPSPFDTWLLTRGIKTLAVRLEQHQSNAFAIINFLKQHTLVKKIYYPGLEIHPNHLVAKKQMRGYGGMISVEFDLSLENMKQLISTFKLFSLAESLGGVESLVCHPVTMTHASIPLEERIKCGITDGLVRFSIGIEDKEDLINDLATSLQKFS